MQSSCWIVAAAADEDYIQHNLHEKMMHTCKKKARKKGKNSVSLYSLIKILNMIFHAHNTRISPSKPKLSFICKIRIQTITSANFIYIQKSSNKFTNWLCYASQLFIIITAAYCNIIKREREREIFVNALTQFPFRNGSEHRASVYE